MRYLEYFQAYREYFWQWEEQGEVVAIPGSFTIAYRKQLEEIMEGLSEQGLPPFGTLLLAILATNPKGEAALLAIGAIISKANRIADEKQLVDALSFLKKIVNLSEKYKKQKDRIRLLQVIFQNAHNIYAPHKSRKFVRIFQEKKGVELNKSSVIAFTNNTFHRDFRPLALLDEKYPSTQSIIDAIAALPEIEEELNLEETRTVSPEEFVKELTEQETTFYVGQLIKRIWSGINIPFHNNVPSHQPLGGVSDLTNKGDFDKLLLSEFANDDLVFMSRLANNEALYYHREIPPDDNKFHRIILIDVSMKNWGTVRTIAFATMLAIARHPKSELEYSVFLVGKKYQAVRVETVAEVIDALKILEGTLHAAEGLNSFFQENKLTNKEVFLISAQEALDYDEVRKVLQDYYGLLDYWLHPTADGSLTLYRKQNNSKKYIQTIQLPLKELWEIPRRLRTETIKVDTSNYPILFEMPTGVKQTLASEDSYVYKITKEGAIFKSYREIEAYRNAGWELLYEKLLFKNGRFAIGQNDKRQPILLIYRYHQKDITLLNISTNESIVMPFKEWDSAVYQNFYFYEGRFFFVGTSAYWFISLDGTITSDSRNREERGLLNVYRKRELQLRDGNVAPNAHIQAFKNTTAVFINSAGELVFNIHRLYISIYGHIKIQQASGLERKCISNRNGNEFTFQDGSKVIVSRLGMFILKSSHPDILDIYIPSILDRSLGVAVEGVFAGNDYYQRHGRCDVTLLNTRDELLRTIKTVKNVLGIGLAKAKFLVDQPNAQIKDLSVEMARNLERELNAIGVGTEIQIKKGTNEKIDTRVFFNRYIGPFIKHILETCS